MPATTQKTNIRWGIAKDVTTWLTFGTTWTEERFLATLRRRDHIAMTAERSRDPDPLGFVIYKLQRHSLELLEIAVHPDHRRTGLATAMLDKLVYKVCSHQRASLVFTVPDDNLPMQLFARSRGCKALTCDDSGIRFIYRPTDEEREEFGYHTYRKEKT
jgi:ribosomal-protein-alanine N-acetyltransferase